jgi:hypothetical protein
MNLRQIFINAKYYNVLDVIYAGGILLKNIKFNVSHLVSVEILKQVIFSDLYYNYA